MKYLLPIAAFATGLIAYAVYRSKRKPKTISVKIEDILKAQERGGY